MTARQQLSRLPSPIKEWALENLKKYAVDPIRGSTLDKAILSFLWHKTPQNSDLWRFVYDNCESKTLLADVKKNFPHLFKTREMNILTVKRQLSKLPSPIKEWALENFEKYEDPNNIPNGTTLQTAIGSFWWSHTLQKHDFWFYVYRKCENKSLLRAAKIRFPQVFKKATAGKR